MSLPQRILVAGSTGFIGRHVIRVVRESLPDALVFGLGRREEQNDRLDSYFSVDVRAENLASIQEYIAARRPDAVVNCLGALTIDRESAMQSNFRVTEVLIRAVPGIKFVHLGSAAEYSPLEFAKRTDESTPTRPVSAYGESKLLATELVLDLCRKEQIFGTVLRVSNPLGPQMSPATLPGKVSEFLMDSGEERLLLGKLNAYRDFVDVRDVAQAIVLALLRLPAISGEVINVGSGTARTARDLVDGMLGLSARNVTLHEDRESYSGPQEVCWQEMDITKAQKLLGWSAEIPWPETLHYTVSGRA